MKKNYPITATFIDEVSMDIRPTNWTKKQWLKDLKAMKSVGIDTVVFIRGGLLDKCIYPSKTFHSFYTEDNDYLEYMLTYTDKLGINVYIGLYMCTGNWDNGNYERMVEENDIFTNEILERYSHHKSFIGWYIPTEVCMDEFNIIPTLEGLTSLLKKKTPEKKIYFCPLYRTRILESVEREFSYEKTYEVWDKILSTMGKDIDSISFTDGTAPLNMLEGYVDATKRVADKYNIEYWANIELFMRLGPGLFAPIQFEVLQAKIEIFKKYAVKLNSFEFSHFMSPNSMYESGINLFKRYKEYYKK